MPNVNTSKSTSPPDGGNVEGPYKTTPQIRSHGVRVTPVSKSSNNQADNRTEFAYLPDESHFQTQQDVNPNGGQLDPSTQIQTGANVKEVNTCSIESTSQTDRERVVRELGVTSTAFIGPARRPKSSIDQELCEFYKELEEVDKVDGDTKSVKEHGRHSSCKPESNLPNRTNIAYRPYPDTHEHNQKDPKRWRPRLQWDTDDFGGRGNPEPWYPPPSWVPPNPRIQFFPPPTSGGGPIMYPPDMRSQENFHSHANNNNKSWGPWEVPPLPSNRWLERSSFQSQEHPGFSEEYETPVSHWKQHDHEKDQYQHLELILLRGVPGSGKSTLGRELLSTGPNGVILSTDDYFFQDNRYVFDSALLGDAHDWNQKRAEQAMLEGRSPVIIDNTNVKAWEMKPYVGMALKNGYRVDFFEPDTHWKYDPAQLEKRNKHGVPRESIAKMLDVFEWPMNVDIVMNSVVPPHKNKGH